MEFWGSNNTYPQFKIVNFLLQLHNKVISTYKGKTRRTPKYIGSKFIGTYPNFLYTLYIHSINDS